MYREVPVSPSASLQSSISIWINLECRSHDPIVLLADRVAAPVVSSAWDRHGVWGFESIFCVAMSLNDNSDTDCAVPKQCASKAIPATWQHGTLPVVQLVSMVQRDAALPRVAHCVWICEVAGFRGSYALPFC
jgi:hypothetical protein